ncbi:hypothetical protein ANO11243_043890 [Dothideomycetidae sp. 11243]|nr:hypothetical protein ANO11243_043890 [fungal sp. No.11243]
MYYRPGSEEEDHNLPHDPFKACVVPRPIGWISTLSKDGRANLAPYSQFNNLTFDPPYVMFSSNQTPDGTRKDTVVNAETTGRFVWNLATYELREAVNITAEQIPYGEDEFERAGLEKEKARLSDIPMVKRSPVKFECEYHTTLRLPGNQPVGTVDIVIGKVLAVHIADEVLTDGILDVRKTKPIARCGYYQYAVVESTFEMRIPGADATLASGLEGNARKVKKAQEEKHAQT